ncbi:MULTISPECIES: hypothetical protein [unclassified Pseudomonas]|uniref:hypothetical protein n=1 Tax=unclassified Pseudomonas TaxID=196821 RepID=UPI001B33ACA8|nr:MULTISPECIES: hypothetical protein [unclassified Pseudomonas]
MSSYIIHIEHREEQDLAWVEINSLRTESRSARRCRFQTIGWILSIVDTVNSKIDPRCLADEEYAKKALIKFTGMDEKSADQILNAHDWRRRFEAAWQILNNDERKEALHLNYDFWDNYWPGFDSFNCTLRDYFPR